MPKGKLTEYVEEPVALLTRSTSREVTPANPYGEEVEVFTEGAVISANVQPLGDDLTETYNLKGGVEALRVQLPTALVAPLDRIRYRGRAWLVVKAERWQGFTVLIVRGVTDGELQSV